jgi:hypothetical protein
MEDKFMAKTCATLLTLIAVIISFQPCSAGEIPQPVHAGTRILYSGNLVVEVGDPDSADCRWNQGQRFSPVANIIRVQLNRREFCYAPVSGGALGYVGGLPMEFDIGQEPFQPDPPGYNEGRNGDPFLKIGVGILKRNAGAYSFSASYPVIELAKTTAIWGQDQAHFIQSIAGAADGYAYQLEEDIIVKNDHIVLHYVLSNTGTKTFTTEQYLHNFLSFSGRAVGPDYRVYFPYDMTTSPQVKTWVPPASAGRGRSLGLYAVGNPPMVSLENMILYLDTVSPPKTWVYKPEAYMGRDSIAVEQSAVEQRVVIDSSLSSAYVGIWTTNYQVSPEQFLVMTLGPDEQIEFTRSYTFSTAGSLREDCTGDLKVNPEDLAMLCTAWQASPDASSWNPACDIADPADDWIDLRDFAALARVWRRDTADPSPLAHWALDEAEGDLAQDSVGQYHGLLQGFPGDDTAWVQGVFGNALEFDGLDEFIAVEESTHAGNRPVHTVSAWIKTLRSPTLPLPILSWGESSPDQQWLLQVDADKRFRVSSAAGFMSADDQIIGDGKWHHIAVILHPVDARLPLMSDVMLYVDGTRRGIYKLQESHVQIGSMENVRMGRSHDGNGSPFQGTIDEVWLYDSVVSKSHLRTLSRQQDM